MRVCALLDVMTRLAGGRPEVRTEGPEGPLDNDLA
jgi:hypothetical protein